MDELNQQLLARLSDAAAQAPVPLEIPPRIFSYLGGHFTAFDEAASTLTARFPVRAEYRNPIGFMQGGMLVAAIDNTMGPLCFLCGFLGVSTQINTTYVRPVTPEEEWVEVEARIVERTQTLAQVHAVARNGAGKTVVLCQGTFALPK
ncbi:MAG: PaaI family thioesterase [Xanthomonadaceae bacterium]|nr:PaaI family thioesterase [Xanthomonadaceae bacterium]